MPKGIPGSRGTCTIEDCEKPKAARGICAAHYRAWFYHNRERPRLRGEHVEADIRKPFSLTDTQTAWLAGLFEGEGHIGYQGNSVRLQIHMIDRDVIAKVCELTHREPTSYDPVDYDKTMWVWTVSWRPDVEELLEAMLPWFGERRRTRAVVALERLNSQTRPQRTRDGA